MMMAAKLLILLFGTLAVSANVIVQPCLQACGTVSEIIEEEVPVAVTEEKFISERKYVSLPVSSVIGGRIIEGASFPVVRTAPLVTNFIGRQYNLPEITVPQAVMPCISVLNKATVKINPLEIITRIPIPASFRTELQFPPPPPPIRPKPIVIVEEPVVRETIITVPEPPKIPVFILPEERVRVVVEERLPVPCPPKEEVVVVNSVPTAAIETRKLTFPILLNKLPNLVLVKEPPKLTGLPDIREIIENISYTPPKLTAVVVPQAVPAAIPQVPVLRSVVKVKSIPFLSQALNFFSKPISIFRENVEVLQNAVVPEVPLVFPTVCRRIINERLVPYLIEKK